ncbi:MAG: formate dehydrogenase accessory sulfurtransferase FdhD [Pseudomonadota bacterium]
MHPDATRIYEAAHIHGEPRTERLRLITERAMEIRLPDFSVRRTLRTPGEELSLAAGILLGEGLVAEPADLAAVRWDPARDPDTVWADLLENPLISCRLPVPPPRFLPFSGEELVEMTRLLAESQALHRATRSAHAVLVMGEKAEVLGRGEDVGRHNALDKALGQAFLRGRLPEARAVVLTCRINQDAVRRACIARVGVLVSISRPTARAVEMARQFGAGLALVTADPQVLAFSGMERVVAV